MDLLQMAKDGLALVQEGRKALAQVVDAVKDGKAGIDAKTIDEIDALFEKERVENRATNEAVVDAIAAYRQRHGG